jgi:nicotinamide-nucleotide amidase
VICGEFGPEIDETDVAAQELLDDLVLRRMRIIFAESCTGGLLASLLSDHPGASRALWAAIVSYSVEAKIALLGVDASTIATYGVVSRETALAMAAGALTRSKADIAVATTGFAGPEAPPEEEGPGRVCMAWAARDGRTRTLEERFAGDRAAVRKAACLRAFRETIAFI